MTQPRKEDQIPAHLRLKRTHVAAVILSTLILVVLGILVDGLLTKLPVSSKAASPYERIGIIHVHTKASDGSGTVAEIEDAAQQANLSFIAITDHNVALTDGDLAADPPDLPIIPGEELTTSHGHFLALGLPPSWAHPATKDDHDLLAAARAAGAFRVLAHPFHPHTPWTDWQTTDFDGMEIWNEDVAWRQPSFLRLASSFLLYTTNKQLAMIRLVRTPEETFAKWDELLQQRPVVGICAADTHARIRLGFGHDFRFPSYEPSFELAREHVLLPPSAGSGDPSRAGSEEILNALRQGHSFCALDSLYPASGFSFRATSGSFSGGPGDMIRWAGPGRLQVSVPSGASLPLIKVFRDGREFVEEQAWTVDLPITAPGRYRSEVFLRQPGFGGFRQWTLWTFTNPVYINPQ